MSQTGLERCERAVRWEKPDRVPVVPLIIQHAAKMAGFSQDVYSTSPSVLAESQIAALRKYGYDGIHITSDNWILPEALGRVVRLQKSGPPLAGPPPLADKNSITGLKLPDPNYDARMPLLIEATKIASGEIGMTHYIKTNFDQGPFSLATAMRGIERFMFDLYENEQFAIELLEFCTEVVADFGVAVAKAGAHAVTFGDATAGLLSRQLFIRFAYPYEKQVIETIHVKTGVPVFLHICGDTNHIVDKMSETGADALELDSKVNLVEVRNRCSRRICLEGNIEPTAVLLQGTAEEVYDVSMELVQTVGHDPAGGFILSSGCEVPPNTPPENIEAMVKAAKAGWSKLKDERGE